MAVVGKNGRIRTESGCYLEIGELIGVFHEIGYTVLIFRTPNLIGN